MLHTLIHFFFLLEIQDDIVVISLCPMTDKHAFFHVHEITCSVTLWHRIHLIQQYLEGLQDDQISGFLIESYVCVRMR